MNDFLGKRLHSLTGLFLTIYIIFHLFTNSQAALFFGDDGKGFIHEVNWIHTLPFLPVIELALLGLPILIHTIWGVRSLLTASYNSSFANGRAPYLAYGRNKAYTWQRITAWLLMFLIFFHVIHMRFLEYPWVVKEGNKTYYMVKVANDSGLSTLSQRIDFQIYEKEQIASLGPDFVKALSTAAIDERDVVIKADNFGTTTLLMMRDTFKSPFMIAVYTLLVLSACFHGFNGLWTFSITWGLAITDRSQKIILRVSKTVMWLVAGLGFAAIYGTYWNLRN